jgi:spermidine synthase
LATRYTGSASESTVLTLSLFLSGLLAGTYAVTRLNQSRLPFVSFIPAISCLTLAASSLILAKLTNTDFKPSDAATCLTIILLAFVAGVIFPSLLSLKAKVDLDESQSNDRSMLLYVLSCAGGATGVLACFIWMLPTLGIEGSLKSLVIPTIFIAAASAPLARESRASQKRAARSENDDQNDWSEAVISLTGPLILGVVAAAAFISIYLECLQIKLLNLIMGASYVTTCGVFTATMLAVAAGARLALATPRRKSVRPYLYCALSLSALTLSLTVFLLPLLNSIFQALRLLSAGGEMSALMRYFYPRMILSLIFCLPATTALSTLFPLAARVVSRPEDTLKLYMAAGVGTMLAPVVFYGLSGWTLPAVPSSMDCQLRLLAIFAVILSICIAGRRGLNPFKGTGNNPALLSMFTLFALSTAATTLLIVKPTPLDKIDLGLSFVSPRLPLKAIATDAKRFRRLFYREGRAATVDVLRDEAGNTTSLRTDGKIEGTIATDMAKSVKNSDISTQTMLALLPLLCRRQGLPEPKDCFIIGFGTGTTSSAMRRAVPGAMIRVADIEPAVFEAGEQFAYTKKWLSKTDCNYQRTTGDARQVLANEQKSFDIIVSQPGEPWVQGSTNLYSAQFCRIVQKRLAKNGIFCQWLPLYGLDEKSFATALATFAEVFPHCLIEHSPGAGEILLLGAKDQNTLQIDQAGWKSNATKPGMPTLLGEIGLTNYKDFSQSLSRYYAAYPPQIVTDDNLKLEFSSVQTIEDAEKTIAKNLALATANGTAH